ncbi:uncharacterized protein G2W53_016434 [Senna tora]|uniref:Uncharacterized protein n=1 Tax=Senna tora TaxID=362788 RepID=A0A834TNV9_9FABA|nr:uncharacterized protein G2W53_016434 [Senna tora]
MTEPEALQLVLLPRFVPECRLALFRTERAKRARLVLPVMVRSCVAMFWRLVSALVACFESFLGDLVAGWFHQESGARSLSTVVRAATMLCSCDWLKFMFLPLIFRVGLHIGVVGIKRDGWSSSAVDRHGPYAGGFYFYPCRGGIAPVEAGVRLGGISALCET